MGANEILLRWAGEQSAIAGLIMLVGGLFLLMQGFRFGKFVLMLGSAAVGYGLGGVLGAVFGLPPALASIGSAALLGLLAVSHYRFGLGVVSIATFAAALFLFCDQLNAGRSGCMLGLLIGAGFGFTLLWVMVGSLTALVTSINGASLAVLGFVAMSSTILPGMGKAFVESAIELPLLIPALIAVVTITGFTYQSNALQGSIVTGTLRNESPVALR